MSRTTQNRVTGKGLTATRSTTLAAVLAFALVTQTAQAQQAIGVPFAGKNHLSLSMTELSRDGVSTEREAVFGGIYGRRFGRDDAAVQYSMIVRAGARAVDGKVDGILDAGVTLAATHNVGALEGLSITAAAGAGAMVWGQDGDGLGQADRGRVVARVPLSAGVAYDINLGRVTIAPFAMFTGAYSRDRDYADNDVIAESRGWRLGNTVGVSVRLWEAVLSFSEVSRERGLPHRNRGMFSAGISW